MGHTGSSGRDCQALHLVHDSVGHARNEVGRDVGAVDFSEVRLNIAHAHAARVHAQNLVVEALERALVLLHQLRLERAVAVARHLNGHVALVCAQRLLARAVARVATALAFLGAWLVAQVVGHLGLQGALHERTGQPFQ